MSPQHKKKQTILNWNLSNDNQGNLRLVMSLAGFDVRDVYTEAEAINLVNLLNVSDDEIVCFLIRCTGNKTKTMDIFNSLVKGGFNLPVLLVASSEHESSFREVQDEVPECLDVHFCYSNSTLDALNSIAA